MTTTRRSPWLDGRTDLLVTILAERHGLIVNRDVARQDISNDLDQVARLMRIGRQAAKVYLTDEVVGQMADRIAAAVAEQHGAIDLAAERRRRR